MLLISLLFSRSDKEHALYVEHGDRLFLQVVIPGENA
jgi:hypothetical protein